MTTTNNYMYIFIDLINPIYYVSTIIYIDYIIVMLITFKFDYSFCHFGVRFEVH